MPDCRGCHAQIRFIRTPLGKSMPVDYRAVPVDGQQMLVFPDGVMAKQHRGFTSGFVPHWATCPKRDDFKRAKKKGA